MGCAFLPLRWLPRRPVVFIRTPEGHDRGAERARCARLQQRRASQGPVIPVGGTIAGLVIVALTAADRSRPIIRTLQVHDPRRTMANVSHFDVYSWCIGGAPR